MRRLARLVGRAAAVALLAALALLLAAHLPPARRAAARAIEARASAALDARLSIGNLDYNVFTRRATLRGVRLEALGGEPILEARRVEVRLPLAALTGARELTALDIDAPRLHLDALRAWLDSRPPAESTPTAPFFLHRLRVTGLDIVGTDTGDGEFSLDLRAVSLDSTPEGRGFRTPIQGRGGWLRAGGYRTEIAGLSGALAFDGERIRLDPLALRTSDHDITATGTIGLFTSPATWDLAVESTTDVGVLLANWPAVPAARGTTRITGTVTGPLGEPAITLGATADALEIAGVDLRRAVVDARVSPSGDVIVERATADALGGSLEATLRLAGGGLGDEARLAFRDIAVSQALALAGLRAPVSGSASGTVTVSGDIADPRNLAGRAEATVRPRAGTGLPASGRLALELRQGAWRGRVDDGTLGSTAVAIDARGAMPGGGQPLTRTSLGGAATVTLASVASSLADLGALGLTVPEAVASRVDGRASIPLTLGGTIAEPDLRAVLDDQALTLRGLGEVTMAGAVGLERGRALTFDAASLTAGTRRVSLDGRADVPGGELALDVAASGWRMDDLRALGLDLDELPAAGTLDADGRLSGTLDLPRFDGQLNAAALDWLGQHVDRLTGRVTAQSRPRPTSRRQAARPSPAAASWNGQITLAGVVASSGEGRLSLDGDVSLPDGAIALKASAARWPLTPLRLPGRSAAEAIDVSALVDLSLDARGTLEAPAGSGHLTLADARYGTVRPGAIDVRVEASGDGFLHLHGLGQGLGVVADGAVRVTAPFTYEATLSATDLDLTRLADIGVLDAGLREQVTGTATGRLQARGTLEDLGQSSFVAALDAYRGSVYGLPLALEEPAQLRASSSEVSSDGIVIRTGATTARAHGTLTRANDGRLALEVDGRLSDLLPLWNRVTGRGAIGEGALTASVAAEGPVDAPRLTGQVTVRSAHVQADRAPGLTGFTLDAAIADGRVVLRRAAGRLGDATFTAEGSSPLHLLGDVLPARVLRANPSTGDATLTADVRNLTIATLGRLAGAPPGDDLSGAFDVRAELAAASTSLAGVTGTVFVDRGTFTTNAVTMRQVGRADIEVRASVARFEEWRWVGGRSDVALRGRFDLDRTPIGYDIEARGPIDLATLGPVMPGRTAGTLRLDARATREGDQGRVTGELVLSGGTWIEREMQVALTEASGTVRLRGDRAVFDGITGRLNGGDITVTGVLGRSPDGSALTGALGVTGRGVTLEFPTRVVNDVDADLQVAAPGPRGTRLGITGTTTVRPGALRASLRELATMFAPAATPLQTAAAERRQRLLSLVGLDIAIETTDDLVANSNDLRAQLGAAVRLTGTLAEPGMTGRAEIREDGELFLAGRLYRLRGGHIEFTDPSRIAPSLSLLGDTRVSEYEVEMQLTGPVERLELRLRSNPPLSQADLASLLTTGQTLRERRENAAQAEDAARAQLLSLVSSEYLGRIGTFLGVDTVRIENSTRDLSAIDLDPVARLSVTKGFGARVGVTYSQSLEENDDTQWILGFKPGWRNVEGKATFDSSGAETYEVRQELELGGGHVAPRRSQTRRGGQRPLVSQVTVEGVPEAEAAELRRVLRVREGRRFDPFRWQQDRERIERFYRDRDRLRTTVSASRQPSEAGDTVALSYRIDRGPVVSLRVEGVALDRTTREALRTAWAESSIDAFVGEVLAETVREALARRDYLQAQVEVALSSPSEDLTEAVVTVVPGPPARSRALRFTGNRAFTSEALTAVIAAAGVNDRMWMDPSAAAGPVEAHYAAAGFLNARVGASAPEFDGDLATLPIEIREGRQFVVADVRVDGPQQVPPEAARRALGLVAGTPFTPALAMAGTNAVRDLYASLGHVDAKVRLETTYDRERSTATLSLSIEEGVRRTIAGVELAGDIATREALTSRAMTLPTAGPVNLREVEEAQRRLYDLGVFRSVEPRFEPVGEPVEVAPGAQQQPVRIVYDVEEYARYRLRYGFQVATGTLSSGQLTTTGTRPGVTVDLRRNNLFGFGFDVGAGGFLSKDRSRLRGLVQSSTLGGRPVQTTLTLTRDRIEGFSGQIEVSQRRTLLAAEQRWRPTLRTEIAYGYNLEYDYADLTLPLRGQEPLLLTLEARLASVNSTLTYDSRDNVLNPGRGTFHSARLESGTSWLASELRFARYLGQHFLFVPAGRVTFASALRFGTVGIDNAQEQSLEARFVRFTTGGGTSVRGYRQDALTPEIVEGFPRGGDVLLVLNQEARIRLTRWFGVVGFLDAGNTFATWRDASLSGLELGIGTGLRVNTPIGVIRLDVGFPRPRPANHPLALWYFSFGQAF